MNIKISTPDRTPLGRGPQRSTRVSVQKGKLIWLLPIETGVRMVQNKDEELGKDSVM